MELYFLILILNIKKKKIKKFDPLAETEPLSGKNPLADGIAVKLPGSMTFPYISKYIDEFVVVSESEISCAISILAQRSKVVVEGAGAATLAAVLYSFK